MSNDHTDCAKHRAHRADTLTFLAVVIVAFFVTTAAVGIAYFANRSDNTRTNVNVEQPR